MSFNLGSILDPNKIGGSEMGQVVILGMGIVFVGLICIILMCALMSAIIKLFAKDEKKEEVANTPVPQTSNEPIANKQELVAVASAAIAEELGTDVEAIRIKSIKKL